MRTRNPRAYYDEDAWIERTQFPRELRNATKISFGIPHGKGIVRPFDETFFLQALAERCDSLLRDLVIRL